MTQAIIPGSIGAIAKRQGISVAESFLSAEVVIICDSSGSMAANDSRGNRSRYDVAVEELARLQNNNPGKVAVIAFSSSVQFVPSGVLPFMGGGTDLAGALKFSRQADVGTMRFIVISDGQPDSESDALVEAGKFKNRIDVIYVGPEGGSGQAFLNRLAKASGGKSVTADRVQHLADATQYLLRDGGV